jgi:hypothetical protein
LGRTNIGDAGVKWIAQNPNITNLELQDNDITDKAVAYLAKMPKLQDLDLANTLVTDRSLIELAKMSTLTGLRINVRRFSPEAIAKFHKVKPACRLDGVSVHVNPELFRPLH